MAGPGEAQPLAEGPGRVVVPPGGHDDALGASTVQRLTHQGRAGAATRRAGSHHEPVDLEVVHRVLVPEGPHQVTSGEVADPEQRRTDQIVEPFVQRRDAAIADEGGLAGARTPLQEQQVADEPGVGGRCQVPDLHRSVVAQARADRSDPYPRADLHRIRLERPEA